jgi:hypothetical protein
MWHVDVDVDADVDADVDVDVTRLGMMTANLDASRARNSHKTFWNCAGSSCVLKACTEGSGKA